jgi:hypothetical protein
MTPPELELIQSQMAQKPMLQAEAYARALRLKPPQLPFPAYSLQRPSARQKRTDVNNYTGIMDLGKPEISY